MPGNTDLIGAGWAFPLSLEDSRVVLVHGDIEIVQAIQIILSTPLGSRVMRPAFGCRIHELQFAPLNASTLSSAEEYVRYALGYWEPRIDVLDVGATIHPQDEGTMLVHVTYQLRATYDKRTLVFPFYTIPEEG